VDDIIIDVVGYHDFKDDGVMYLMIWKNDGSHAARWVPYLKVQNIADLCCN